MSLTSYRAAPPRGEIGEGEIGMGDWCGWGMAGRGMAGPGLAEVGLRVGGVGEPGGDLLFRRLSGSTIGAEGFHGRVRDGIGCLAPRCGHQAGQPPRVHKPPEFINPGVQNRSDFKTPPWDAGLVRCGVWTGVSPQGVGALGRGFAKVTGREVSGWRAAAGRPPIGSGVALAAARGRFSGSLKDSSPEESSGSGGFERLVPVGCGDCSLSTSGLSTWWSSTALDETWF